MKRIKPLISMAVMAVAASTALGLTSAAAAELCSTNTDPCSGTKYGSGTSIEATLAKGTKATLAGGLTVTCAEAAMTGKTTNSGGEEEAVKGTITSLSFGKCEAGGACTVEVKNLPYNLEIGPGDAGNGVLFLEDESGLRATVKCGFVSCTYAAEEPEMRLEITGGNPAIASVEKGQLERIEGGFLCSPTATMTVSFQVGNPAPVHVVNRWMRANFEPFDFGDVTVNNLKMQKIVFRYLGGGTTDILSAFVTNQGAEAAFKVNILGGNPDEDCKKRMGQGQTCYVVIHFEPKTTGAKEAKVSVDDALAARHFEMIVKGKGV
jgi:hypothetical protein